MILPSAIAPRTVTRSAILGPPPSHHLFRSPSAPCPRPPRLPAPRGRGGPGPRRGGASIPRPSPASRTRRVGPPSSTVPGMRIESSVLSLSWIPSEAVTGLPKQVFEVGVTHYDEPPPDSIGSPAELRGAPRRGAVPLREPPDRVDRGRGRTDRRRGVLGRGRRWASPRSASPARSATVRARSLSPTSSSDPELHGTEARFVQTAGGRAPLPAPRHGEPSTVLPAQATRCVDDARAHDPRGRHVDVRGRRCEQVPSALDLRRRRSARSQGRARRLPDWYRTQFGKHTPWGREDSPRVRDGGGDRARAPALVDDHARRREARRSAP